MSEATIPVKIAGLTRIRNEESIILDTLNHYAKFCTDGIYIYDDCSTDNTYDICRQHQAVISILHSQTWDSIPGNRPYIEGIQRREVHKEIKKHSAEWIFCFDADERVEFDFVNFDYNSYDYVSFQLFDYYITPEDINKQWYERKWIGPEYRRIPMLFREHADLLFSPGICRIPRIPSDYRIYHGGFVKHYGKAISVEHWEEKCKYYTEHFDEPYKSKWEKRKGNAIHKGLSDFGLPLIKWEDKEKHGMDLSEIHTT